MAITNADVIGYGKDLYGLYLQNKASKQAEAAQTAATQADIQAQKEAKQLFERNLTAAQKVSDAALNDYRKGLISYAEAQRRAGTAYQGLLTDIGKGQGRVAETAAGMAAYKPYTIKTATGATYFNPKTGQMEYRAGGAARDYQQQMYQKAAEAAKSFTLSPEEAAQKYYEQQQAVLEPGREAQSQQLRAGQLASGRLGMGLSSEAAGAGAGGVVNPEQFAMQRANAQANAQIAAQATQAGQQQQANQLAMAQGLFKAGAGVDQMGMGALELGGQLGQYGAQAGYNQGNLYQTGMQGAFGSMGAAGQQGMLTAGYLPDAYNTGNLAALNQANTVVSNIYGQAGTYYNPVNYGPAQVPASAYRDYAMGNYLLNR